MRNFVLGVAFMALPIFAFCNTGLKVNSITFPTGVHSISKSVLEQANKIYNKLGERNYANIQVKGENEDSWDPIERKQLAKKRCLGIQSYFVGIGINRQNILIDYNGAAKLILFKPRATLEMSGKIDLAEIEQQCFMIDASKKDYFKTKFGNVFVFPAGIFENDKGISIRKGKVNVCVWEFAKKKQMVKGQIATGSSKLLETASAFYIQAYYNNKELKVDAPRSYKIYIKHRGETRGFKPYYGMVKNGNVEWVADKRGFAYESMFDEGAIYEQQQKQKKTNSNKVQFTISKTAKTQKTNTQSRLGSEKQLLLKCKKIGWVNCDRETKVKVPVSLTVKVDGTEEFTVRMLFKKKNIVVPGYSNSNYVNQYEFAKVPNGENVVVVAYKKSGTGYKIAYNEINLGFTRSVSLVPQWVTQEKFNQLIEKWGY